MERNQYFDNLKGILILFVVMGHLLGSYVYSTPLIYATFGVIYTFHMPLFIFVSGFFSKNVTKSRAKSTESLLFPYLIFSIALATLHSLVAHKLKFSLVYPGWTLWFFLSLFTMRYFLMDISKLKYSVAIFVILGISVGIFKEVGPYLSLSRTIFFMPFFLLGYYANGNTINSILKYKKTIITFGIMMSVGLFILFQNLYLKDVNEQWNKILYFSNSFFHEGLSNIYGVLLRAAYYCVSLIMCLFIMAICPQKTRFQSLSRIGKNSLIIYIAHIYLAMVYFHIIHKGNNILIPVSIVLAFIICYLLSFDIIRDVYNKIISYLWNLTQKGSPIMQDKV